MCVFYFALLCLVVLFLVVCVFHCLLFQEHWINLICSLRARHFLHFIDSIHLMEYNPPVLCIRIYADIRMVRTSTTCTYPSSMLMRDKRVCDMRTISTRKPSRGLSTSIISPRKWSLINAFLILESSTIRLPCHTTDAIVFYWLGLYAPIGSFVHRLVQYQLWLGVLNALLYPL